MPEMDGLKVLKFIKNDPLMRTLPVILLTSRGSTEDIVRCLREGADDYIVKPLHQEELLARVQAHLRYKGVLEALDREKAYISALYEITKDLALSSDYHQILHAIVRRMAALLDVYRCSIILVEEAGIGQVVASNEDPSLMRLRIELAAYPEIARALGAGHAVIIEDVDKDPIVESVRKILRSKRVRSLMVFPIFHGDTILGVLFLRGDKPLDPVSEENLKICQAIANATAPALEKAAEIAHLKEELRLKERYEFLFSHASDGLLTIDARGKIMDVNESLLAVTGYTREELQGRSFTELVTGESLDDAQEIFRKFRAGDPPFRFDIHVLGKEGKKILFSATGRILPGKMRTSIFSLRDVTERRRLAMELERTTAELREKEREAMIVELAGAAAHELNQPLTSILGLIELIRKDIGEDDPCVMKLKEVSEQVERMAKIVRRISQITKYEAKPYAGGGRIIDLEKAGS